MMTPAGVKSKGLSGVSPGLFVRDDVVDGPVRNSEKTKGSAVAR
jgi:hypothetical protein